MSDSVRPQRQQPTRLPCPWDSPGKNTGVGCHFLLQCMKVKSESEVSQSCPTLSRKVMPQILQARLHQYMNCELPDVQAGFRKGRGIRDQIANICCIIKKAREFQKDIGFCFIVEKEMATHSSTLAWRIPGTGEPGGLLSLGSHRVGHD